jgi:hypothetical protein
MRKLRTRRRNQQLGNVKSTIGVVTRATLIPSTTLLEIRILAASPIRTSWISSLTCAQMASTLIGCHSPLSSLSAGRARTFLSSAGDRLNRQRVVDRLLRLVPDDFRPNGWPELIRENLPFAFPIFSDDEAALARLASSLAIAGVDVGIYSIDANRNWAAPPFRRAVLVPCHGDADSRADDVLRKFPDTLGCDRFFAQSVLNSRLTFAGQPRFFLTASRNNSRR